MVSYIVHVVKFLNVRCYEIWSSNEVELYYSNILEVGWAPV
jgi:hypothetical protein